MEQQPLQQQELAHLPQQEVEGERATKELHQQEEELKLVQMHYLMEEIAKFRKIPETLALPQQDSLEAEEAEEVSLLVHLAGTDVLVELEQEELSAELLLAPVELVLLLLLEQATKLVEQEASLAVEEAEEELNHLEL